MQARVAKRYAKALFDLATEKNSLDAVYNDINLI
ncbi:MAG: F0F1 ATP synthase subunit delta, partial [Bacteroidia bacterium]|nr:F0F1 ATP synthase subunit delta [Bacteroidia bacterium]